MTTNDPQCIVAPCQTGQIRLRKKLCFCVMVLLSLEGGAWFFDYIFEFQRAVVHMLDQMVIRYTPIGDPALELVSESQGRRDPLWVRAAGELNHQIAIIPEDVVKSDERRVFLLGGSAAFGFPYEYELSFPALLNRRLEQHKIRVINAASVGTTSGEQLPVVRQIVDEYEPDTLIVYSGNNEWFHWQPHYRRKTKEVILQIEPRQPNQLAVRWLQHLCHSRLVAAVTYYSLKMSRTPLRKLNLTKSRPDTFESHDKLVDIDFALAHPATSGHRQQQEWLQEKEQFLDQFEDNLREITRYCAAANVRVIMMTVPFNYRLSPAWKHRQPESFNPKHEAVVRSVIQTVPGMYESKRYADALNQLDKAIDLDPYPPVLHYLKGMCLQAMQKPLDAERAYAQCREHMIGNLGSCLSINERIVQVANEMGATLVDLRKRFDEVQHAKGGHFNADLIHDDCHPTPLGHQIIAGELRPFLINQPENLPLRK